MILDHAWFVFGAQVLRRLVERELELGGAFGIAAELWPHQVAQVAAVLADVEVRHILGDEVGLGKTVQALAIARALRLQRPELKVAIVVPDEMVAQWRDECLARDGRATLGDAFGDGDDRRTLLVWPGILKKSDALWLEVERAQLLIVDELVALTQEHQKRLLKIASGTESVLFLTANPPMSDLGVNGEVLRVIEPGRSLGEAPWSTLIEQEERAAAACVDGDDVGRSVSAACWGATRRILRTRREEFAQAWPERVVRIVRFSPTPDEIERQVLLWQWMSVAKDTTRDFDLVDLAQRVRSLPSLRQRVTYLVGHGHDRQNILVRLKSQLDSKSCDSRYEALLDVLSEIWEGDPSAKVVINGHDNLTVDQLARDLPRDFDQMSDGLPLAVSRIRNQRESPEDIVDPEDVVQQAIREFCRGSSQVMLLTRESVKGINLQIARHIVFFSTPWRLDHIDQLIGRVDRIDPGKHSGGSAKSVTVWVLAQRGLVDDRVTTVLQAAEIFHRPVAGDRDDVSALQDSTIAAALADGEVGWERASKEAERVGSLRRAAGHVFPLRAWQSDRGPRKEMVINRFFARPPEWPTLGKVTQVGWVGRVDALRNWLEVLDESKLLKVRESKAGGTLFVSYPWHHERSLLADGSVARPLDVLPRTSHSISAWTRQSGRAMKGEVEERRSAREMLDHGGDLHDSLLRAWLPLKGDLHFVVSAADGALSSLRNRLVRILVAAVTPSTFLPSSAEMANGTFADLSDNRFVGSTLVGRVLAVGVTLGSNGSLVALTAEQVDCLLRPSSGKEIGKLDESNWTWPGRATPAAREGMNQKAFEWLRASCRAVWTDQAETWSEALKLRVAVLKADRRSLPETQRRIERLQNVGHARSLTVIQAWIKII